MSISKIDRKYCLGYRAQLMLAKGYSQVVFSKNGTLYLKVPTTKNSVLIIHKYLTDKDRAYFPYHDNPVSQYQHNNIFECDQIYANITCAGEESVFNFNLFKKLNTGDVLVEELALEEFKSEETEFITDAETIKKYLVRQSDEDARYIFDWFNGITYVSSNDCEQEINNLHIPLDSESILAKYNKKTRPLFLFTLMSLGFKAADLSSEDSIFLKKEHEKRVREMEIKSIDEVKEFSLTRSGCFEQNIPYIVVLKDGNITVTSIDIIFVRPDEFLVKQRKHVITKDNFIIEKGIDHSSISYTKDPTYIKTDYPPINISHEEMKKNITKALGISYEQLFKMNKEEIINFIEAKIGKKIPYELTPSTTSSQSRQTDEVSENQEKTFGSRKRLKIFGRK